MENMIMGFIFLPMLLMQSFMAASAISQPNFTTDQYALLQFKASITSGPFNITTSNWSYPSTSVCNWVGVSCGALHHRVTALNLPNMNLTGSLPPHFGNLSFLVSLNLSGNNFYGHLPPELGKLKRLRYMDLSNNSLDGSIPDEIWLLSKLEIFRVESNQLTGIISRNIGNLTMLRRIYVGETKISGEIPEEIGNLHSLESFAAERANLSGPIPPNIFNISSLKYIFLYANNLSGTLPSNLGYYLPNLQILALSHNRFTGYVPRSMGNFTALTEIDLGHNYFEGEIPEAVGNLPLKVLIMSSNFLAGSIPSMLFNISTLEIINLAMNSLSGHLPITFKLPKLTGLYLYENKLGGIFPSSISNSSLLTNLEVPNNLFSGHFPNSLGDLRFLEFLHLAQNNMSFESSTSERSFFSSLTNCQFLGTLSLSFNPLNNILSASIGNLSISLQYLYLANCKIHGNIPAEIGNLSNLISLSLMDNDLTRPIPATIRRLQKLQGLFIGRNKLQGAIPNDLCHLERLDELILSHNQLNGSMPDCLDNLTSLRYLYFDFNNLSSTIPSTFWSLRYILEVNLSSNSINGSLPLDFANLKVLTYMDLSRNKLSGNLPSTIDALKDLTHLSFAENTLQGKIPQSFGGLVSLEFLDLSNNLLSGVIPKSLEGLSYLKFFNVSFNRLEGEIPSGGLFGNFTAQSFMRNTALCGLQRFQVPPCKSNSSSQSCKKFIHVLRFVLPPIVATVLILTLLIIFRRQHKSKAKSTDEDALQDPTKWRRISYQELQQATERFSERNLLGKGSFGSVYNGILQDRRNIAIKVFNLQVEDALRSFDIECEVLRSIRHRNLIKIISCCCNEDFKALVLEFMPNGTLERWLHSDGFFVDLLQRVNIMIDVASALEYLHHGHPVPIIHCDLKPSNVLLDEDMVAHVGDFGLAKLLGEGEVVMQTMRIATIGYLAPEYGSLGMVSAKGDVYSYGILLMETFTRRRPTDELFTGEMSLKLWVRESLSYSSIAEIVDANLVKKEEKHYVAKINCVTSIMELALDCCAESPRERPNMMDVVTMLKKMKEKYLKDVGVRRAPLSRP